MISHEGNLRQHEQRCAPQDVRAASVAIRAAAAAGGGGAGRNGAEEAGASTSRGPPAAAGGNAMAPQPHRKARSPPDLPRRKARLAPRAVGGAEEAEDAETEPEDDEDEETVQVEAEEDVDGEEVAAGEAGPSGAAAASPPATRTLEIRIPPGKPPGSRLKCRGPGDMAYTVVVPAGAMEGAKVQQLVDSAACPIWRQLPICLPGPSGGSDHSYVSQSAA